MPQVYDFPTLVSYTNYSTCVSQQPGRSVSAAYEVWKVGPLCLAVGHWEHDGPMGHFFRRRTLPPVSNMPPRHFPATAEPGPLPHQHDHCCGYHGYVRMSVVQHVMGGGPTCKLSGCSVGTVQRCGTEWLAVGHPRLHAIEFACSASCIRARTCSDSL